MASGLDGLKGHRAVRSVEDGRRFGDPIFIYLKPGFEFDFEGRSAGFRTIGEAQKALSKVQTARGDSVIDTALKIADELYSRAHRAAKP